MGPEKVKPALSGPQDIFGPCVGVPKELDDGMVDLNPDDDVEEIVG